MIYEISKHLIITFALSTVGNTVIKMWTYASTGRGVMSISVLTEIYVLKKLYFIANFHLPITNVITNSVL